jgi:FtsP/CotA-like multicopper oxidase with cupredoxin domain
MQPNDPFLQLETVWQFPFIGGGEEELPTQIRFVPGSETSEIVAMQERGKFRYYASPDVGPMDFLQFLDVTVDVMWQAIGGFQFDPSWPENRFIYFRYRGSPLDTPWPNKVIDTSQRLVWISESGIIPVLDNNEQYCPVGQSHMTETYEMMDRFEVDENWNVVSRANIYKGACSGQMGHARQTLDFFPDGSMVFVQGDHAMNGVFYDEGSQDNDACFNSDLGYPQGMFRSQRMEFDDGKAIIIEPEVYRTAMAPITRDQYQIAGKGFRQPFRIDASKTENKVYIADVGDGDGERIFVLEKGVFYNAGWPCIEGWYPDFMEEGRKVWLRQMMQQFPDANYDVCEPVYAVRDGVPGGDPDFQEAQYSYREKQAVPPTTGPIDPDYLGCTVSDGGAISAIAQYHGKALGPDYNNDLFFGDYTRGCVLRFAGDEAGVIDFTKPEVVVDGKAGVMGLAQLIVDPRTELLYIIDYLQTRIMRLSRNAVATVPVDEQLGPLPQVPMAEMCEATADLQWKEQKDGSFTGELSVNGLEYTNSHGTTRTRGYDGRVLGPIMRVQPGRTYYVTLKNEHSLDWPNLAQAATNTFKDPCTTNLHTHGLHISGDTPADDTAIAVAPGEEFVYTFKIPDDHTGGTHFYHNHHHGSTSIQVGGGLFGLMIVEDNKFLDVKPKSWPTMPEQVLVMHSMSPAALSSIAFQGKDALFETTAVEDHYIINGCEAEQFEMTLEAQRWTRVRALHVGRIANIIVTIQATAEGGEDCKVGVLSLDGVYLAEAPRMVEGNTLFFSLASRVDFAIHCPAAGLHDIIIADAGSGDLLATSVVKVTATEGAADEPILAPWEPIRPYYLQDLRAANVLKADEFDIDLSFTGMINDTPFGGHDAEPLVTVEIGTVVEWGIRNIKTHPFHMHINHMQLQGPFKNWELAPGWYQPGDFVDLISLPDSAIVRFRPERYVGRALMHCHVYEHAEQGMSAYLQITGDGYGALGGPPIVNWPEGLPEAVCGNGIYELGEKSAGCFEPTCDLVDCGMHGTCKAGSCTCDEGYVSNVKGATCLAVDPCDSMNCGANSLCMAGKCKCDAGYQLAGGMCTIIGSCDSVDCGKNGLCQFGTCICTGKSTMGENGICEVAVKGSGTGAGSDSSSPSGPGQNFIIATASIGFALVLTSATVFMYRRHRSGGAGGKGKGGSVMEET